MKICSPFFVSAGTFQLFIFRKMMTTTTIVGFWIFRIEQKFPRVGFQLQSPRSSAKCVAKAARAQKKRQRCNDCRCKCEYHHHLSILMRTESCEISTSQEISSRELCSESIQQYAKNSRGSQSVVAAVESSAAFQYFFGEFSVPLNFRWSARGRAGSSQPERKKQRHSPL
jgi:hypothetical protein